eukprot:CAMPEP_0172773732 /NCGR_PEP_ID=MMETSP1074-20121228/194808_1 /TAXON_ID=2916 /ORGANISM="Ceratium fusus, Strain PA161109" /LENGTH=142 /DNA_ID=CAMNT_0013610047 /DNA_START=266 /DNA_END=691 /DNA_ORIENTATION=-
MPPEFLPARSPMSWKIGSNILICAGASWKSLRGTRMPSSAPPAVVSSVLQLPVPSSAAKAFNASCNGPGRNSRSSAQISLCSSGLTSSAPAIRAAATSVCVRISSIRLNNPKMACAASALSERPAADPAQQAPSNAVPRRKN